jgi:2-phospho-L-lactate guanylyltransferase
VSLFIAIPVKPFGVAKARLSPVLDARQRSLLGKQIAAHTVVEARSTGARVAVVTGNGGVANWAEDLGVEVVAESIEYGSGLDGAAAAATAEADRTGSNWMILHADLPHLSRGDLKEAMDRFRPDRYVLAPSYNGGTTLLMGAGPFPFHYGPASFHHHLRSAGERAEVLVRRGLALDLDTPHDLETAQALGMTWHRAPA